MGLKNILIKKRKDKELHKELTRSYEIHLHGNLCEKIKEAHKTLQYDLNELYTAFENDITENYEYYQEKIDSMEYFIDYVMKAIKDIEGDT